LGVTYRSIFVLQGPRVRYLGDWAARFNLGLSDFQFWFQGLIGQYSQSHIHKDYRFIHTLAIENSISHRSLKIDSLSKYLPDKDEGVF